MSQLEYKGLWQPQIKELLDICVVDIDAQFYVLFQ